MHKDVLEFIDSPDIRTFHQKTVFTPAQQAVLVMRSGKKTVDEKIEMLEYLIDIYAETEFDDGSVVCDYVCDTDISFYENIKYTMKIWKDMLCDRTEDNGYLYAANLMEKEIFPERESYRYFSSYEKAYEYLKKEKDSYLKSEYLKDIPTIGIILGIKPDTENRWDNDEYWFDSDMNLIEISGRNERYQISKNKTVQPVFSYAFHLELPFHVGDIVKAESFQRPPLWGVIYYEWEKPKKPEFCTMNIWLDVYDDKREKYDFVDDEDILTLTFAKEDDIPEEERYKLKMLSMARKGELDFYELLLDRGILL
ncbi:MAG: hypothetical protein Q4B00_05405 [Eubacteriales bacterium]|nr:hypothetical protein [Eubacteriales bacterium]